MKKLCIYLMFVMTIIAMPVHATVEIPNFAAPIHLFEQRDLGKEMYKQELSWIEQIIAGMISHPRIRQLIHTASGDRTMREIGYQQDRIEAYSGKKIVPDRIILTGSGKSTLQETINAFFRQPTRLAHNFFIDKNGDIHPVTQQGESVEDALLHRPFAVGTSCHINESGKQEWDMNSHSITISLIGKDHEIPSPEQKESLIRLTQWLSKKFTITSDMVLDYGCIAQPYGRRTPQPHLPWKELHNAGLALYPTIEKNDALLHTTNTPMPAKPILWLSAALQKLGYRCNNVTDQHDPSLKSALQIFQQHHQCDCTDGTPSRHTILTVNAMLEEREKIKPNDNRWPPSIPTQKISESSRRISGNCKD